MVEIFDEIKILLCGVLLFGDLKIYFRTFYFTFIIFFNYISQFSYLFLEVGQHLFFSILIVYEFQLAPEVKLMKKMKCP
jgi:hypothetical protein